MISHDSDERDIIEWKAFTFTPYAKALASDIRLSLRGSASWIPSANARIASMLVRKARAYGLLAD